MSRTLSEADHRTDGRHPPIQARAQKTRAAILTAAATQFDTLGYAETSISTIVAGGNLTKGAIYFHFTSKEAIALQLIADWNHTVGETISITRILGSQSVTKSRILGTESTKLGQLTAIFASLADRVATDPALRAGMKLTLEPSIDDDHAFSRWVEDIHSLVDEAITAGELGNHPAAHRLAWNLCTGTVGAAHAHTTTPQHTELVTRIDDTVAAHLIAAQRRSSNATR
ncbi:TetR/AcrR family transcriptional regulator [Rhodococcus qingshengii]|uniref:TetR/AcrR family transcriptional regulator n=1 Tax=Rhodococcus qingshengii TaxID=334542 RepID=UPI00237CDE14|nr:TetR/AcrR family transcriptional regulator [Rhodococcus qingshengii]WCT05874.1 TetR family transcriptional regulator [Rhodococcus qingshengii]